MYVRYCEGILCRGYDSGRVHFISDGSVLINSLYDQEFESKYLGLVPQNDNRKWILDVVAEALILNDNGTQPSENSLVIFDESDISNQRFSETHNLLYYLLIYFTNDWMTILILFLILFYSSRLY